MFKFHISLLSAVFATAIICTTIAQLQGASDKKKPKSNSKKILKQPSLKEDQGLIKKYKQQIIDWLKSRYKG